MTGSQRVGAHYDAYHELYRRVWGDQLHHGLWRTGRESQREAVAQLTREVVTMLELAPGLRVHDVGCGYGVVSEWMTREWGAKVLGITCSRRQFAECARRAAPDLEFRCADWTGLAVERTDRVLALETAEHLPDKKAFLLQAGAALPPGGLLLIAGWMAGDVLSARQAGHLRRLERREPGMHLWSARRYRTAAECGGFAIEREIDLTRETRPTWTHYLRRFVAATARDPALLRFIGSGGAGWLPLTFWRISTAFRSGALRYAILTARRMDSVCLPSAQPLPVAAS